MKPRLPILLAPPLLAMRPLTSMQLYLENITEILEELFEKEICVFNALKRAQVPTGKINRRLYQYFGYPNLVRRVVKEIGQEHGTMPVLHILDQHYGHLATDKVQSIATCHDLAIFTLPAGNPIVRWLDQRRTRQLQRCEKIFAISENTAKDLERILKILPEQIILNYYGLDPVFRVMQPSEWQTEDARKLKTLEPCGFYLLHVGQNVRRKNMIVLLRALRDLIKTHPLVKLVKVGEDLRTSEYSGFISEANLWDHIIYLGKKSTNEIVEIYNACDAFVFPSLYEGFGRPVLEAQACGLPVVLAKSSSLPEVGGDAALYHEPEAASELAAQIRRLYHSPEERDRIRVRGFDNIRNFSWDRHAEILVQTYQSFPTIPS